MNQHTADTTKRAKLYVILGSHACRTAMLTLDHKGISYDVVTVPSGLHPLAVRLAGFSSGENRKIDERPHRMLALADHLGTVPALRLDGERVETNRNISRLLDRVQPEPALFPEDPAARERVEEIELWGDEVLQMGARRLILGATPGGHVIGDGADGRLGPLLFHNDHVRRASARLFGFTFAVGDVSEATLLANAREMLDRVDAWIEEGLLNGDELNAADFMVAPSVALLSYHTALAPEIDERPVAQLLDRVLPLPLALRA